MTYRIESMEAVYAPASLAYKIGYFVGKVAKAIVDIFL